MKANSKFKSVGMFSIILLAIVFLSVIPSVSSIPTGSDVINTFLNYEDSLSATSKTVTQGDSFNLILIAYGHGENVNYEKLELVGSTLIFEEHVYGEQILDYTYLYTKTYTLNTGILNPGQYTLRFTAITKDTHSEEYSELKLTILPKTVPPVCGDNICNGLETCSTCPTDCGICSDTIAPVVIITNPLAMTYTSQRTILTFTVYDDNLDSCFYKLNEAPKVDIPSVVNGFNTITGISSVTGANDWLVTCKDKSGNMGSYVAMFTVSPPNPPICGDNICNGNENCSTCPTDCGVCPPICGDNVCNGNENCSTCAKDCGICSDTIAPVVIITNPLAMTYTSQRTILTFTVYDDNLDSCFYKLNEAPKVDIPSVVNGFNTITGISSVTGANDWLVTCKDKSGNMGSYVAMFTVSPPNPPICGDNICNGNENCSTCPTDCGICQPTCGDGVCNGNENCSTCPCDCGACKSKCTSCKDYKPIQNDDYIQSLNKKITTIYQNQNATVLSLSLNGGEKSFLNNKYSIVFWILIIGILVLLMAMLLTRLIKR